MYGTPIWREPSVSAFRRAQTLLNRLVRAIVIRVISVYKSVSLDIAILLARIPALYIAASARKHTFERIRDLRTLGNWIKQVDRMIRVEETLLLRRQWDLRMQRPNLACGCTRGAILQSFGPCFDRIMAEWPSDSHRFLSGHGCFSVYLLGRSQ